MITFVDKNVPRLRTLLSLQSLQTDQLVALKVMGAIVAALYFGVGSNDPSGNVLLEEITAVSAVPLPAALPLFATGLGALGLLGWRGKKSAV